MALNTEMSEISVVSFTADKTQCIPGETITITTKLKNISGATIKVWSVGIGIDSRQLSESASYSTYYAYPVGSRMEQAAITWKAGATKAFTWTVTIPESASNLFANYGARAVKLIMDITSGAANELSGDTYVSDVTVLNARYTPTIEAFELKRALNGEPNDEGTNLLTTIKLKQVEHSGYVFNPNCAIIYAPRDGSAADTTIDLTGQISTLLAGVTDSAEIVTGEFLAGQEYDFMLVFGDENENIALSIDVDRAFANHALSEYGAGASYGMFPTSTPDNPKLESNYPCYFYKGINGLNTYSLEEVDTGGKWIDGKSIYSKTLPCKISTVNSNVVIGTIPEIDTLVDCSGHLRIASSGTIIPVNRMLYTSSTNITAFYFSITAGGNVTARTYGDNHTGEGYITLYYTKTGGA